jgi:hypothetical protein
VRLNVVVRVRVPDVPVIVIVVVPGVTAVLAVNVSVLDDVAGFGLNEAVTPLGRPDAAKLTLALNPFAGVMLTVLLPLVPCTTLNVLGAAASVKLGAGVIVRLRVVVSVRIPDVPVIVTVAVPVFAVALAVSVSVLVEEVGFGLNAAFTPLGKPDAARFTLPLNPFSGVTVRVSAPLFPSVIVRLPGAAVREKFGAPGQLATRFVAFTLPMPVAKSHPTVAG